MPYKNGSLVEHSCRVQTGTIIDSWYWGNGDYTYHVLWSNGDEEKFSSEAIDAHCIVTEPSEVTKRHYPASVINLEF